MNWSKCLIDISAQDAVLNSKFSELHPDISAWVDTRSDGTQLDTSQIIRYLVACYDKESPLVNSYKKRWAIKKRESAIAAGFKPDDSGSFTDEVHDLILCKNDEINKVILRYLYLQHDRLFQTYVIYSEMYLHQSREILKYDFQQPAHAKAAKENLDTLNKDIEELEFKIFSGEETKVLKDMLYEESGNLLNDLRPERIAIRLEQGLPAVDYNPYGNYKKEPMRFIGDE